MLALCRKLNRDWGIALLFALGAAALSSIISPAFHGGQRDGFITICTGSGVKYLPLAALGDASADTDGGVPLQTQQDILCACQGPLLAILSLPFGIVLLEKRAVSLRFPEPRAGPLPRAIKPFHSQGPPFPAA